MKDGVWKAGDRVGRQNLPRARKDIGFIEMYYKKMQWASSQVQGQTADRMEDFIVAEGEVT